MKDSIFYIENTVDERRSKIICYCKTLDEAKEALKWCSDWYAPLGTGRIYEIGFGLHESPKLVFENR